MKNKPMVKEKQQPAGLEEIMREFEEQMVSLIGTVKRKENAIDTKTAAELSGQIDSGYKKLKSFISHISQKFPEYAQKAKEEASTIEIRNMAGQIEMIKKAQKEEMKKEIREKIIKSEDWGRFIEHRPYFRQMPQEDWEALKLFVEEKFSEYAKEIRKEGTIEGLEDALDIVSGYPEANVVQPRLDIKNRIKELIK